ncbi:HipA domain-containing protein [Chryseobacterium sp. MDT2-18]|uniref:HipA domain-containing protein n=1 Tax=Chryseobacterium sp. MDT2-18 TaxID=1259136 RepID=UPI002780B2B0|nr:HipA domain-containing protein [Chryseobacterium sp. MDT2-18]MDQ0477310.1 serine/threonine protein kinase HipA of HipAB toxin-antitoxin module [Chryseobacterium sp. MDT2-18]
MFVPASKVEGPKLFILILFNYLFSNGDAHLKNFSLIETEQGDFKLSPAYDLLNTKIHIEDADFALSDGLLPKSIAKGKIKEQFILLGQKAEIPEKRIAKNLTSHEKEVIQLTNRSYLGDQLKRNFIQLYQTKLKKVS